MKSKKLVFLLIPIAAFITILMLTSFNSGTDVKATNNTPGTVVFTATTLPAGGNYAPKHVLAIWVEKDGVFVKTRKAMANQRKQYLYKWAASSNYNVTDAITGATLPQHQTHTVQWNCTDLSGNVMPDGNYTVIIEFTDKHAQGPWYAVTFNKGTEPVSITPPNQQYIINMQLTYTPEITVTADFSANITQACPQQEIVFTDNSTGATSWSWNFGAGSVPPTANTQGPHTVTYSNSGLKTVSLTINGGTTVTKDGYILIHPAPEANFSFQVNSPDVQFTNSSLNASSYLWDFGDGNTSTATNPSHTYIENGQYQVSLTASNVNCGSDVHTELVVITTVGINEVVSGSITAFPNPSAGAFYLTSDETIDNTKVSLYDIRGKLVFSDFQINLQSGEIYQIGDHLLKPGVYLLNVSAGDLQYKKKLIVN
ncbi:MAG: DUF2271 domain-containing protein [Bacteroidales bacterium]|nr:DUF2271 domain-containing protein [Bacteroidales bacterium]